MSNYNASADSVLHILRVRAQTDPLLNAQIQAAFWEAVATTPTDEGDDSDGVGD